MGRGHPECPQRLDAIEDRLLVTGVGDALERREAPEATAEQIDRAHDPSHRKWLLQLQQRVFEQVRAGGPDHAHIDPDTAMNSYTWEAALRAAGLSWPKISYLRDLAEHVVDGRLDLHGLKHKSDEEIIAEITAVKGFGRWSAEMFLMFCLHRPDVFPVGDLGIVKGVPFNPTWISARV